MRYRADIDGLRALAVLLVLAFHAFPKVFFNGFLGVDIFFVISGFLITSIIFTGLAEEKFSFLNFYFRRVKRILPPSLLIILVVQVVSTLTLFDNEFEYLKKYIRAAAGFYINFRLMLDGGYFDIASQYKPLMHFWSLAIEEQFYVVWPLLLFLQYKILRRFLGGQKKMHERVIPILLVVNGLLLVSSLGKFLFQENGSYFSSFLRSWELLAGCLAAIFCYRSDQVVVAQKSEPREIGEKLVWLGYVLIFLAQLISMQKINTPLTVLGTVFFLVTTGNLKSKHVFRTAPVLFVGHRSYSLYLWHWPLLSFARIFQPNIGFFGIVILLVTSFVLSHLTYVWIEAPLKKQSWDSFVEKGTRYISIGNLLKGTGCVFVAFAIYFLSPMMPKLKDRAIASLEFVEDEALNLDSKCWFRDENFNGFQLSWCANSKNKDAENFLVVGDSHAHSLFAGLASQATKGHWWLVGHHGCPIFPLDDVNTCMDFVKPAYKSLQKRSSIKAVIFVMANRIYREQKTSFSLLENREKIARALQAIVDSGKEVVIMRPVPEIAGNIHGCVKQRFSFYSVVDPKSICEIAKTDWDAEAKDYEDFLLELKQKVPALVLVNSSEDVCRNGICSAVRDGRSMYYDKDHLSFYGSGLVARRVFDALGFKGKSQ